MSFLFAQSYETRLIPFPQKANFTNGKLFISQNFSLSITGKPDSKIYDATNRFLQRLSGRTGIFFNQYITPSSKTADTSFVIEVNRPGEVKLNEDESYTLNITEEGIILKAETSLGAMHGLETLLQLLSHDDGNYFFPSCSIQDKPRFTWRGLMMDVSRHFMPVDVVKRNIDGMAAVKMNVLHLHLTDDQGFRLESKVFPKLHIMGSDGEFFSQEQIKDIIQYANNRGIRVVPEFDIPGHATSWFVGHPELASDSMNYSIERRFGIFDPTIDPTKEYTYEFLDKFLSEMAQLFNDEYMHIGGDENNGKQWDKNKNIQAFMKEKSIANNHSLQAYFNTRLLAILEKNNKKMIGWEELMQPEIPKTAVIQSWRGRDGLTDAAKSGYQVILSNGFYIDLMQPAKDHYLNDPLPMGIDLNDEQKKFILGGEATMWAEMVTHETVDSRIWPRTAAIAERLWSPASVINIENMYKKLDVISVQLEELGLTHIKNIDMILRRLIQSRETADLHTFVNIVEPVKNYERSNTPDVPYRTLSPFTRIVDAAQADARDARLFNSLVEQFLLGDIAAPDKMRNLLSNWITTSNNLKALIVKTPVLKEIEPITTDIINCSKLALEAMDAIQKQKRIRGEALDMAKATIETARKHKAQMELAIIPGVEKLLEYSTK